MATYKEIQDYVKSTYGFVPKTCWIAHMKEVYNIPVKISSNRNSANQKIRRDLFPVFRKKDNFDLEERKSNAQKYIADLMHITLEEQEYMEAFEKNEYRPELLFESSEILQNIKEHPRVL